MIPAFRYGHNQADRAMQFLVYLTVLMVSVSTILLEVHWLTSPAPPPKPAIQASAPAPTPKAEGPNAALSPVYPKKTDAPPPADSASNVQQSTAVAIPQAAPVQRPEAAAPAQQAATAVATPLQRPAAETTGTGAREDDGRQQTAGATNVSHRALQETAAAPSNNRCDVQACAGAYKSFRASDCTYQSFEGPRRACTKPPVQRTAREQRNEPERRKWSRDVYPRELDRSTVGRRIDDDDDEGATELDDDSDRIVIHRFGPRW
jgi:BA14K-like protein